MSSGPEEISHALARLSRGGIVAFPTETVYGLGADALDDAAVRRVFELKGRPPHNPLIVHVADEAMARSVASAWPKAAHKLAEAFWPGPLTIVVPKRANVPDIVTGGGPTVAVRCPAHHLTLTLLHAFGRPLVGPSANLSGRVSPTTADHVRRAFSEEDVYVLDGGPCRGGIESTVVALTPSPRVLRRGLIGPDQIAAAIGQPVEVVEGVHESDAGAAPSPGLLARHYAPVTPTQLFLPGDWPGVLPEGRCAIVLTHRMRPVEPPHRIIQMPAAAEAYAAQLYAALREADAGGGSVILIERPTDEGPLWDAIRDRLTRAAAP